MLLGFFEVWRLPGAVEVWGQAFGGAGSLLLAGNLLLDG
jgi:hypothetical protein